MISGSVVGLEEPRRWRRVLEQLPHGFAHTWESCHAHSLTTQYRTFLYHLEADGARVACPLAERPIDTRCDVVTPFGFSGFVGSGPCPSLPHRWCAFARERGYVCGYIALNPLYGHRSYGDSAEVHPNTDVYVLNLTLSDQDLHRRLSRNRRRELRDWRPGLHDDDHERLTQFLLTHYRAFMRDRNAAPQYDFAPSTLEAICGAKNVFLLGARGAGGRIEAVRVVGHTRYGADDLFLVYVEGKAHHSTPLVWSAVDRLRDMRIPSYTLGGGVRPGDSIARSKQRFGGARLPLCGLKQVYDPAIYEELCRRYGQDPGTRGGYFPPYRAR